MSSWLFALIFFLYSFPFNWFLDNFHIIKNALNNQTEKAPQLNASMYNCGDLSRNLFNRNHYVHDKEVQEDLWSLLAWGHSKDNWKKSRATWSRCPFCKQQKRQDGLNTSPSNLIDSVKMSACLKNILLSSNNLE